MMKGRGRKIFRPYLYAITILGKIIICPYNMNPINN